MPAVSVIVPVYNSEKYLEQCIESLAEQTLPGMEVIVVDDGSTDSTPKILKSSYDRYPDRIRILTQENAGQGSARNAGLRAAQGEYVGFLDADDYADRRMYAAMYTRAKSGDLDLVECDFHYLEEDGTEKRAYGSFAPWNKLIRRELLTKHGVLFPEGFIYEDTSFYLKLLPFVKNRAKMMGVYVYHRDRGDSTMNENKSVRVENIFPVLQDAVDFYRENELTEEYGKQLEYYCTRILLCSSLGRISRIRDRKLRKRLQEQTFDFLKENFPQYRKNPYLGGSARAWYLRFATPGLCKTFAVVLGGCRPGRLPG